MSENNGSAWPNNYPQPPQNNYGQQPSNAFGSQPGGYSAWSNNGQQAPYGPYGQPGTGGPSGPFGPSGPYGPGGPSAFSPQKKFPWVAVIIGFIAVACIVVGILFATGVIGSDDEKPVAESIAHGDHHRHPNGGPASHSGAGAHDRSDPHYRPFSHEF